MLKKIDVYVNGLHQYSSVNYGTLKAAIADVINVQKMRAVEYNPGDKVTAKIDRKYGKRF